MPRASGRLRDQSVCQAAEQVGVGAGCSEGKTDAGGGLDDTGCDLEKPEPDRVEFGRCQITRLRDGVAHGQNEPIGGGVEDGGGLGGGFWAALRVSRPARARERGNKRSTQPSRYSGW